MDDPGTLRIRLWSHALAVGFCLNPSRCGGRDATRSFECEYKKEGEGPRSVGVDFWAPPVQLGAIRITKNQFMAIAIVGGRKR